MTRWWTWSDFLEVGREEIVIKKFVIFVGGRVQCHPSFMEAYRSGIVATWVDTVEQLRLALKTGCTADLIVFDSRNQSEHQCAGCREAVQDGRRVVCIGGASVQDCESLRIGERNLLGWLVQATNAFRFPQHPRRDGCR